MCQVDSVLQTTKLWMQRQYIPLPTRTQLSAMLTVRRHFTAGDVGRYCEEMQYGLYVYTVVEAECLLVVLALALRQGRE